MPCNFDVMVDGRFPDDFPDALKETWRNIGHVTPSQVKHLFEALGIIMGMKGLQLQKLIFLFPHFVELQRRPKSKPRILGTPGKIMKKKLPPRHILVNTFLTSKKNRKINK